MDMSGRIENAKQAEKRGRRKWRIVRLAVAIGTLLLMVFLFVCWWWMIFMPGESFHGELADLDDAQMSLGNELRGYVNHLSVEIGERNINHYPALQQAADYVEGQFQGGAAQGIGWALNEEYIYGEDGRLQNPGFLDYRIPVCSDLPFIDTQILEIPNPNHPYGIRGVGETSIVPPLAAIGNAVSNAVGVRMNHVPMSPPRILKAIDDSN